MAICYEILLEIATPVCALVRNDSGGSYLVMDNVRKVTSSPEAKWAVSVAV